MKLLTCRRRLQGFRCQRRWPHLGKHEHRDGRFLATWNRHTWEKGAA